MLVSHDRYFLDVTVRKIAELWNKGLHFYTGGYTRLTPSPPRTDCRSVARQDLLLSRTMLSNEELPYVGRFAYGWPRLATTDPHAAHTRV